MRALTRRARRLIHPVGRALVVMLFCGALVAPQAVAFFSVRDERVGPSHVDPELTARTSTFRIQGKVLGLTPGKREQLRLRLINQSQHPIRVKWVSVRARKSNRLRCSARALRLPERRTLSVRVGARDHRIVAYPIRLRKNASRRCQAALWPLRYRGEARRAR